MGKYKLVAFDMDGTLLNSRKNISDKTLRAVQEAIDSGVIVIFNTGRCLAELNEYFDVIKGIRYVNCVSGALVIGRNTDSEIYSCGLDTDTIEKILRISMQEDLMVHFLSKKSIVQKDKIENMAHYHMEVYQEMYERVTTKWDNIYEQYFKNPFSVEKLNLYHTSAEARERTRQRIVDAGLNVELVNAETTALEISSKGIDKGIGLEKLCGYLNISLEEIIVAGDADNDIGALKKAGLAVAMGNANNQVKAVSDVIVSDNDHDGCAEIIKKYIL